MQKTNAGVNKECLATAMNMVKQGSGIKHAATTTGINRVALLTALKQPSKKVGYAQSCRLFSDDI